MVRTPWNRVWPGLPQLWCTGSWQGLAVAAAFAALFNFLLIATFGWTEWIPAAVRNIGWVTFCGGWLMAVVWSVRQARSAASETAAESSEDLFRRAQEEYLKGAWLEAETTLNRLLRRNGHDLPARLMLATLFRHTQRVTEAGDQLRRLERCDGSETWKLEIESEWALLKESAQTAEFKTAAMSTDEAPAEEPPEIAAAA